MAGLVFCGYLLIFSMAFVFSEIQLRTSSGGHTIFLPCEFHHVLTPNSVRPSAPTTSSKRVAKFLWLLTVSKMYSLIGRYYSKWPQKSRGTLMANTHRDWWSIKTIHDDVMKFKHFSCYWNYVRKIYRSLMDSLQRPVTQSFDVFFDVCLNKRLSKQSRCWWFETPWRSLWRHRNEWIGSTFIR